MEEKQLCQFLCKNEADKANYWISIRKLMGSVEYIGHVMKKYMVKINFYFDNKNCFLIALGIFYINKIRYSLLLNFENEYVIDLWCSLSHSQKYLE